MIVAIDGPAASGKGTIARRVAERFGFAHLDTGLLYRAVARALLDRREGLAGDDAGPDRAEAERIAAEVRPSRLDPERLRTPEVDVLSARIAAWPEVRRGILACQRSFAFDPPGGARGAVLDGRDIGSVVCPEADPKVFVTASERARAERRLAERLGQGFRTDFATVLAEIRDRDARDLHRETAPLRRTPDAVLLDTTELAIETAVDRVAALVAARQADSVGPREGIAQPASRVPNPVSSAGGTS